MSVTSHLRQALCDFTGFVRLGRPTELGPTRPVFAAPRRRHARRFIAGRFE